jgi:hypothetical protein
MNRKQWSQHFSGDFGDDQPRQIRLHNIKVDQPRPISLHNIKVPVGAVAAPADGGAPPTMARGAMPMQRQVGDVPPMPPAVVNGDWVVPSIAAVTVGGGVGVAAKMLAGIGLGLSIGLGALAAVPAFAIVRSFTSK